MAVTGGEHFSHEHLWASLRWGGWQLSLRTRFPLLRGKRTALGIHFSAFLQWGEARWQSSHQQTVSRGCGRRLPGLGPLGNQHASPTPPSLPRWLQTDRRWPSFPWEDKDPILGDDRETRWKEPGSLTLCLKQSIPLTRKTPSAVTWTRNKLLTFLSCWVIVECLRHSSLPICQN